MKTVFADTGYWIARVNPDDDLYSRAREITIQTMPVRIVTTELIFAELLNAFSRRGSQFRKVAVSLIDSLIKGSMVEVISQATQLFNEALSLYSQRLDQAWSHTDHFASCKIEKS